jgi:hypothetical protein
MSRIRQVVLADDFLFKFAHAFAGLTEDFLRPQVLF